MRKIDRENTGWVKPGQDLVVVGYAGYAGTVLIVQNKKEELYQWFSKSYIDGILTQDKESNQKVPSSFKELGASDWEEVTEGGILKALWNLSGAYMTGIRVSLLNIPVRQETIEICERYDLNPYRLFSTGCVLLTADHGEDLVSALKEQGGHGAVIGKVTGGIKRTIEHGGSVAYLDRPTEDELYQVLSSI
ncbi:AIR synthase-related protein [Clostridium sp. E02]|uniref:AIR synthase-related protein n=1 Tax=Clostridium sp. E02 TaxID=2487134 RepID=UPI000F53791A|nr:AIR synthase-related protein [Clostridium sp. E02]